MAKILIVDDVAANRTLVATLVGYRGHQALEAADGAEALALVRAERPALVISDILMPTMDGFEFVRRLRADPELAATEVIFYSAHYRERETQNLARACGVSRVLIKPCEPEDVLRAIDEALAHAPGFAPAPDEIAFDREHVRLMTDKLSEKVAELEAANARLEALTELNLQLASERDPQLLLEKVCRGARELIVARYAVLCVKGTNGGAMIYYTSGIDIALTGALERPDIDLGVAGAVFASRQARRIINPDGDATAAGLPAGYPPFASALVAPVVSLSRAYGWICLADKLGASEFSAEDEHLLSIHAAQAGRIYENGSLYAEVQRHAGRLELEVSERKRTAEHLRTSEAGLNRAQQMARLTHVITGPEGQFESWPDTMPELIGTDAAGVPADTRSWLRLVHPDDRARFREKAIEAGVRGTRIDFEYRLRGANGTWLHIRQVMEPLNGHAEPNVRGRWFNTLQDVTGQKQAESKIRRLNRVYAVLSGINTLIVRVRKRDELFEESCRIAVEHGHFKKAWIGMVDRQAMKIVPVASAGAEAEFLELIRDSFSLREGDPLGNTMSAQAVRERIAVVSNDMHNDPRTLFAKSRAERGVAAMAILPLLVGGESVGVLALYAGEVGFFDAEEMKLLAELAGDIAFALEKLAGDAAKRESEARYRTLFDASPDAIRVSCEGKVVMANPAYRRLLRAPSIESLVGRDSTSHLPAAWLAQGIARGRMVQADGVAAPLLEMEFLRDDGELVAVEVTTLPYTYEGKPAALSIVHDLSGRNANLRSLKEAELRYRSLVETSLNGVIILDGETIEYANPTFAQTLGFTSPAAAAGTGILSLLEPEFRERVRRSIKKLGTHAPQSLPAIHLRMRRLDGGTMDVQASAAAIVLAGRTLVQAEMRDITRERRALAEIGALNRSLEARVAERTAELTLANRDLAAANSDLESFSYSVAHDLRAPLRTMDGFANLLALDVAAGNFDEVPRHVDRIARNVARMNDLIDGLLTVARVTHGALAEARVDFALLVAQIVQDARPPDHVLVEVGALPVVRGDISALRQLWTNLISNALKYSAKRDRPEVCVTGEPAGAEFVFHIRDNGAGFDPTYTSRLFGVFQRLHPAQEFEGTGVGLAVVRRVAERHGGRVWAEGKPGAGATFHFSMPLARIEMPAME